MGWRLAGLLVVQRKDVEPGMKLGRFRRSLSEGFCVTTSKAYTAVLTMREETVLLASALLQAERTRRGTRRGRRRWAALTRPCLYCAGSSTTPGWCSLPPTTSRCVDSLPPPARGHRSARSTPPGATLGAAGRKGGRAQPRHARWHTDRH